MQSALKQKVASLRKHLSAAVATASADAESRLTSARKELGLTNEMIGKLRAELQTGRDQMVHNRHPASDNYSCAVGERLKAGSNHRHDVLAWLEVVLGTLSRFVVSVTFVDVDDIKGFVFSFFYCRSGSCSNVSMSYWSSFFLLSVSLCQYRAMKCCRINPTGFTVSFLGL